MWVLMYLKSTLNIALPMVWAPPWLVIVTPIGMETLIPRNRFQDIVSLWDQVSSLASVKQPTLALSSIEAQNKAACFAACEAG